MNITTADHARIVRWIRHAGGEITRNRLRRYRPRRIAWEPVQKALDELILAGIVEEYRNELEPLERGCGKTTTRYRLRLS
jgi:hypothetical protein